MHSPLNDHCLINTKKEMLFYIKADEIMNGWNTSIFNFIKEEIFPNYVRRFLRHLRCLEYYDRKNVVMSLYHRFCLTRLSYKCGFSIATNVLGYGVVIPHYGTIVVGGGNTIGNYTVLHTSTCITAGNKKIGDGLYLSTGAKVLNDITLNDNVSIGANSLVNKSFEEPNIMIAGCPAKKIKSTDPWYIRDGEEYMNKVRKVEELKKSMGLC